MSNVSLVTAFKPFKGVSGIIQRSSMFSWQANNLRVFVPNSDIDTKANCSANITVLDGVRIGRDYGFNTQAPIIKDLVEKALPLIDTPMVALLNSDIIIRNDFSECVSKIFETHGFDVFLVASRQSIRLDLQIIDNGTYTLAYNQLRSCGSDNSDIFITSKFMWRKILRDMPDFIMGRYYWEDWLISYAEANIAKRFNCTNAFEILHPVHGYEFLKKTEGAIGRESPSSKFNLNLMKNRNKISIKNWGSPEI